MTAREQEAEILRLAGEYAESDGHAAFVSRTDERGRVVAYGTRAEVARLLGMGQTPNEPSEARLTATRDEIMALADGLQMVSLDGHDPDASEDICFIEDAISLLRELAAQRQPATKADVLRIAHEHGISAEGYEAIKALLERQQEIPLPPISTAREDINAWLKSGEGAVGMRITAEPNGATVMEWVDTSKSPQPVTITDEAVEAACASYAHHRYGGEIPWPEGFAEDLKQQDVRAHMRAALEAAGRVAEQPQPGTITAEHHERVVREAVKAAYERAADKCAELRLGRVPRLIVSEWAEGYCKAFVECAAAIRAMGESDE